LCPQHEAILKQSRLSFPLGGHSNDHFQDRHHLYSHRGDARRISLDGARIRGSVGRYRDHLARAHSAALASAFACSRAVSRSSVSGLSRRPGKSSQRSTGLAAHPGIGLRNCRCRGWPDDADCTHSQPREYTLHLDGRPCALSARSRNARPVQAICNCPQTRFPARL
jgi:hypothetical protein